VDTSGHVIYDPTKSGSAQLVEGATWNISYGDGSSASGNVYTVYLPNYSLICRIQLLWEVL
jgi:Eukaryotic aspartyl protease